MHNRLGIRSRRRAIWVRLNRRQRDYSITRQSKHKDVLPWPPACWGSRACVPMYLNHTHGRPPRPVLVKVLVVIYLRRGCHRGRAQGAWARLLVRALAVCVVVLIIVGTFCLAALRVEDRHAADGIEEAKRA